MSGRLLEFVGISGNLSEGRTFFRICRNVRIFCRNVWIFVGMGGYLSECEDICRNVRIFCRNVKMFVGMPVICRNVRIFVGILSSASEYAIHGLKMSEQNRSTNTMSGLVKLTKIGSLVAVLRGAFIRTTYLEKFFLC